MPLSYNFGPIARTKAGGPRGDVFNLAALPLHVVLDALMAATSRDEFVAWVWHDLFKPAFYWREHAGKLQWIHIPGHPPFQSAEATFAKRTGIPMGLVSTHHAGQSKRGLGFSEAEIIEDQFDQKGLGRAAHFVQLCLSVEPAMATAVLRSVIEDSFIEAVVSDVAQSLRRLLASKSPSFSRMRFVFETRRNIPCPKPTDAEIWLHVGQHYDIQTVSDELRLKHTTPVAAATGFDTEVTIDLSGRALTPEEMTANTLGLAELLVVYQDSRTVIMAVPQHQVYRLDLKGIASSVLELTRSKLQALDIRTHEAGVDLLAAAFEAQVTMRVVPPSLGSAPDRRNPRPISLVVRWPTERLDDTRCTGKQCCLCASHFDSSLATLAMARPEFTDAEFIGLTGDICPLCRIYWYNTHQYSLQEKTTASQGMRKALRGSFALVLPSSRFDVHDQDCQLAERPPLDVGGRFGPAHSFERITVTQQEFALFNQISRRIVARLWRRIEPVAPLPLPYLGGILLTHREANLVRQVLPALRQLFTSVTLQAYPFEAKVVPNVELALEVAITDLEKHHTKHTYLKSRPATVPVHPDTRFLVLADSAMQLEISRDLFEACDRVTRLVGQMSHGQRREWMRHMMEGADPATAYYQSTLTRLKHGDPATALNLAAAFWTAQFGSDPAQAWSGYEQEDEELGRLFSRFPMLCELLPALMERKENDDDRTDTANTTQETDGGGARRSAERRREPSSGRRSRARRQAGG